METEVLEEKVLPNDHPLRTAVKAALIKSAPMHREKIQDMKKSVDFANSTGMSTFKKIADRKYNDTRKQIVDVRKNLVTSVASQ
jgi:hypothetical protein